jgi:hypothetical protein
MLKNRNHRERFLLPAPYEQVEHTLVSVLDFTTLLLFSWFFLRKGLNGSSFHIHGIGMSINVQGA